MGRPIKRQFLDFNVPSTTQGHLRTLVKKQTKRNTGKKERKITEVKRALQSTKENRTPKVEKLSGTQSKKQTKTRRKTKQRNKTKGEEKTFKKELHKVLARTKSL